jgi:hypothetical protein
MGYVAIPLPYCNTSKIKEIDSEYADKLWLLIQLGEEKTQKKDLN